MALHDAWSYDHAPQSTTDISAGTTLTAYTEPGSVFNQNTGVPGMLYKNTGGTGYVNTDGFLYLVSSGSWNPAYLIRADRVQDWTVASKQHWFGFRTKYVTTRSVDSTRLLTIADSLSQNNNVALLSESDLTSAGLQVSAQEVYIEVFIDRNALTYQVYANGAQIKTGSIPAAVLANGATGTYYFFGGMNSAVATANANRCFTHHYWLNVDATTPGRQGSIRSSIVPEASASAPNYTTVGVNSGTLSSGATLSTTQSKFGGSALFPGTTAAAALTIPDNPGLKSITTADFTMEAWVYLSNTTQNGVVFGKDPSASVYAQLQFYQNSWRLYLDSSSAAINVTSGLTINTWVHIAVVRYNNTWYLYQNGVQLATAAGGATTFGNNTKPFYVGNWGGLTTPLQGYIDEARLSNVARYTGAFTPPTAAFTPDANTTMLLHMDALFMGCVPDSAPISALNALLTALQSPALPTPTVQSAATNDTLTLGFAQPASVKILAVDFRTAAFAPQNAQLAGKLTQGGSNLTLPTYTFSDNNTIQFGRRLGLTANAPDGNAWSAAKLAAAQLAITPNA